MKQQKEYVNFLLEWSKSGSKESFIELCEHFYQDVYCTAYQLLHDTDLAFRITKETFAVAWKNIKKYNSEKESKFWILEITIILCFFRIKKVQDPKKNKTKKAIIYGQIESPDLNPVEEEYNTLTFDQKISIILASKLKFSLFDMRNVFEDLGEIEVRDLYKDAFFRLTGSSLQKNLHSLSKDDIQILVNAEERGDIYLSGFDDSTLNSLKEFDIELDDLFTNVKADPSLLQEIKENLLKDADKKTPAKRKSDAQKRIYDKAIKSAINDLMVKRKMLLSNKKVEQSASGYLNKSLIAFLVFLIGFFTISYLIDLSKRNTPWEIQSIDGEHTITGEDNNTLLNEGNILKTDSNSILSINVEDFGKFTILGQADFKLEKGYESNNIVHFNGDHLEFSSIKKPFILKKFAEEPTLTIVLGSFSLKSDVSDLVLQNSIRHSELYVIDGWVEIQYYQHNLFIGKGYFLDMKNKLSIPYYRGTSDVVKSVANDPSIISVQLDRMLSASEEYDILTLWHLLNFAQKRDRYLIAEKLAEFTPIFDKSIIERLVDIHKHDSAFMLEAIKRILTEGLNFN